MTDHSAATVAGITPAPGAKLEPDAIGAAQDTIIGMASSAPAATVGLSLAALAAATAYGSGPILILTAIPMLIIANAYWRLNLWKANTGASFEWVGRAINPYLGFLTGWLVIAAYISGPWPRFSCSFWPSLLILAVALLTIIYTLSQVGFQGVLSPGKLQAAADNGTALVTVAQVLGGAV